MQGEDSNLAQETGKHPCPVCKKEWGGTQHSAGLVKGGCIRNAVVLKDG
jgi:hypothetical protein